MKRERWLVVALCALVTLAGAATAAVAQQPEDLQDEDRGERILRALDERFDGELSLSGFLFENFFQAPDGVPETRILAARTLGRVGVRVGPDRSVLVYGEFGRTFWEEFEDSNSFGGGIRSEIRRHSVDLFVGAERDRPTLDVGDEFDVADIVRFDGEYGYRITEDWELKGLAEVQTQSFDLTPGKDNTISGFGGAVRYRGAGYEFSPEVGFLAGGRDAQDEAEDHSQTDLYVKVRSVPAPRWYLSFRYRFRTRGYAIGDPADRNFGRDDDRHQVTALAVYELLEPLDLEVYYALQKAESTLPSRTFTTQHLMAGLSYRF